MAALGFYADAPYKIVNEGREITLKLQKTSPTTAKVVWNIPKGAPGCSVDDLAYNGIVIVADNVPIKGDQTPTNQKYYTGDAVVNSDIHAGDRIGSGLVIGAFYDDKTTTTLEISGLVPNTPYYIAGFAVDNVGEYHKEGVHSYSQSYQEQSVNNQDKPGYQYVQLGIAPTDSTGLDSTQSYSFNIDIDGTSHVINLSGLTSQTYSELVNTLNEKFSLLNNPYQGTNPPNYGTLYVNGSNVGMWDGSKYIAQNTIVSTSIPTSPLINDYWYNEQSKLIYRWDGSMWNIHPNIQFKTDPTVLECGFHWFNGQDGYRWDGHVWVPVTTYVQPTDPTSSPMMPCGAYWFDTATYTMYRWNGVNACTITCDVTTGSWKQVDVLTSIGDPRSILVGDYWLNVTSNTLSTRIVGGWNSVTMITSVTIPLANGIGSCWFNPSDSTLFVWDGSAWNEITDLLTIWHKDPSTPSAGDLWWDDQLYVWDEIGASWSPVLSLLEQSNDPAVGVSVVTGSLWHNGETTFRWDGMQWIDACAIEYSHNPLNLPQGTLWFNTTTNKWFTRSGASWTPLTYIAHNSSPTSVLAGQFWLNPQTTSLFQWNGIAWIPLMFSSSPISVLVGAEWYNTTEKVLYSWTGGEWEVKSVPHVIIDEEGCLQFFSGTNGSSSSINLKDNPAPTGLFISLTPAGRIQPPMAGTDGVLATPSYNQLGVGTDGTSEERREMVENILMQLGYPTIQVELTKQQLDFCVDQGLQTLRRAGSSGYERVYFFINLKAGQQHYVLSDKLVGFNKIVDIMKIHRTTSAFLGTAEGQGVYGQIVLQHLYSMGNFDLVSYHIINEYIELMEKMFAADIMYSWKEKTRTLSIKQNLWRDERILVDAVIERTEQDILADRYMNNWIQLWATSEACMILAETRGKFSSLPGAGGGISLNSSDLRARGERGFEQCMKELEDFVANDIEAYGGGASFIMG